jgi:hypothetical protein
MSYAPPGETGPLHKSFEIDRYPPIALAVSLLLLIGGFLFFAILIGRYPLPYFDEAMYNYPAVSFLKGHGLLYAVSSSAPFGNTLWAYHGPFYPHLQVLVFRLFGISQEVSRLPNLIAGYSAACLMVCLLWRERYRFAPLVFVILWLGDRSTQELQYARMDGLALLMVVFSFIMVNRFYSVPNRRNAFCGAIFGASAVAFHPGTGLFLILSASLLCFIAYKRKCLLRTSISYGAGLAIVTLLVLMCIHFHPIEALQQLRWNLQYNYLKDSTTLKSQWTNLLGVLRWSKWFFLALVAFTAIAALPIASIELRKLRREGIDSKSFFRLSLTLFAVAGLACLITKAVYPYYIIYFSIWPIALLAMEAEQRVLVKRPAVLPIAIAAILFVAWLPSAGWNALRMREEVRYRNELKDNYILGRLKESVPPGAEIFGDPLTYMLGAEANLNFTPAPYVAEHFRVSQTTWLFLSKKEYANPTYFFESDVRNRPVVFCSSAFPGAKILEFGVCLLGPLVK